MLVLLASTILAASPAACVAKGADIVVNVPRADQVTGLVQFFGRAGRYSAMLSPTTWAPELIPLIGADLRDPAGLTARGIDPKGPVITSFDGQARVACFALADPALFQKEARERLEGLGTFWKGKSPGTFGAEAEGVAVSGVTVRGKGACIADDPKGANDRLAQAAAMLKANCLAAPRTSFAQGEATLTFPGNMVLGLHAENDALTVDGSTTNARAEPKLRPGGPSVYGAMKPSGLGLIRARVAPESLDYLTRRVESQLATACPGCDRKRMGDLVFAVGEQLTGDAVVRIDRVNARKSLATAAARFFAVKHAMLCELRGPNGAAAAKQLVDAMKTWPDVRATDRGYALTGEGGELELGVSGNHFFFGNDEQALTALLQELPPAPAPLAHGAVFSLDPKLVHKAFAQVSLLDLMSSKELAGVVAVGTELGPLFFHTQELTGWADPAGKLHRFNFRWVLEPAN